MVPSSSTSDIGAGGKDSILYMAHKTQEGIWARAILVPMPTVSGVINKDANHTGLC